jgi:hypothetical protein
MLNELRALLKASSSAGQSVTPKCAAPREDAFKEVWRRKRNSSSEAAPTTKKAVSAAEVAPQKEVPTRNFFAPLKANMDTDSAGAEATANEKTVLGKARRPPPIILTSQTNFIQLQKQLKNVVKGDFKFRSTRNVTKVVNKGMADFEAVKSHFTKQNLSYYSFFPKSQKPIKAVIRHLPPNNPAKDISEELGNLGFDVISVKQMTTTRRSPSNETTTWNLPLFLITLSRTAKSQDIFKLPCLCHISIKVDGIMILCGTYAMNMSNRCSQYTLEGALLMYCTFLTILALEGREILTWLQALVVLVVMLQLLVTESTCREHRYLHYSFSLLVVPMFKHRMEM